MSVNPDVMKNALINEIEENLTQSTNNAVFRSKFVESIEYILSERDTLIKSDAFEKIVKFGIDPSLRDWSESKGSKIKLIADPLIDNSCNLNSTVMMDLYQQLLSSSESIEFDNLNRDDEEDDTHEDISSLDRIKAINTTRSYFEPLFQLLKSHHPALFKAINQHPFFSTVATKQKRKKSKKDKKRDRDRRDTVSASKKLNESGSVSTIELEKNTEQIPLLATKENSNYVKNASETKSTAISLFVNKCLAEGSMNSILIAVLILSYFWIYEPDADIISLSLSRIIANSLGEQNSNKKTSIKDPKDPTVTSESHITDNISSLKKFVLTSKNLSFNPESGISDVSGEDVRSIDVLGGNSTVEDIVSQHGSSFQGTYSETGSLLGSVTIENEMQSLDYELSEEEMLVQALAMSLGVEGSSVNDSIAGSNAAVKSDVEATSSTGKSNRNAKIRKFSTDLLSSSAPIEYSTELYTAFSLGNSETGVTIYSTMISLLMLLSLNCDKALGEPHNPELLLTEDSCLDSFNLSNEDVSPHYADKKFADVTIQPSNFSFLLLDSLVCNFTVMLQKVNASSDDVDICRVYSNIWILNCLFKILRCNVTVCLQFGGSLNHLGLGVVSCTDFVVGSNAVISESRASIPLIYRLGLSVATFMYESDGLELVFNALEKLTTRNLTSFNFFDRPIEYFRHGLRTQTILTFARGFDIFYPQKYLRLRLFQKLLKSVELGENSSIISALTLKSMPSTTRFPKAYYDLFFLQYLCLYESQCVGCSNYSVFFDNEIMTADSNFNSLNIKVSIMQDSENSFFQYLNESFLDNPVYASANDDTLNSTTGDDISLNSAFDMVLIFLDRFKESYFAFTCKSNDWNGVTISQNIRNSMWWGEFSLLFAFLHKYMCYSTILPGAVIPETSKSIFSLEISNLKPIAALCHFNTKISSSLINVSEDFKTVSHRGPKQWISVCSQYGIQPYTGIYEIQFRIDKCDRGQVLLGLLASPNIAGGVLCAKSSSSLNCCSLNESYYLGCNEYSWGLLGNSTLWHNGKKQRADYGTGFSSRLSVKMRYDSNCGTLSFSVNDSNWGVAFSNLPKIVMFPAVSLHDKDDKITLNTCTYLQHDQVEFSQYASTSDGTFEKANLNMSEVGSPLRLNVDGKVKVLNDKIEKHRTLLFIKFSQALFSISRSMLERHLAAFCSEESTNKSSVPIELVLSHPYFGVLLPSLSVSIVTALYKDNLEGLISLHLLPYLTVFTKQLASLRDRCYSASRNSSSNSVSSYITPIVCGEWKFVTSGHQSTFPAQEYFVRFDNPLQLLDTDKEFDSNSNTTDNNATVKSNDDNDDIGFYSSGFRISASGKLALSNDNNTKTVNIIGTQYGSRIKFVESWGSQSNGGSKSSNNRISNYCIIDGRLSLCGTFFCGKFIDPKSGKVGVIEGSAVTNSELTTEFKSSRTISYIAKSRISKLSCLLTMACGKLAGLLIKGIDFIRDYNSSPMLMPTTSVLSPPDSSPLSNQQVDYDSINDMPLLNTVDTDVKANLQSETERWLTSVLFSNGLPFDDKFISLFSQNINDFIFSKDNSIDSKFVDSSVVSESDVDQPYNGLLLWWLSQVLPEFQFANSQPNPQNNINLMPSLVSQITSGVGNGLKLDEFISHSSGSAALLKVGGETMQAARRTIIAVLVYHSGTLPLCKATLDAYQRQSLIQIRPCCILIEVWKAAQRIIENLIRQKQRTGMTYEALTKSMFSKADLLLQLMTSDISQLLNDSYEIIASEIVLKDSLILLNESETGLYKDSNKLIAEAVDFLLSPLRNADDIKFKLFRNTSLAISRTAGFRAILTLLNKADDIPSGKSKCQIEALSSLTLQSTIMEYVFFALHGHKSTGGVFPITVAEDSSHSSVSAIPNSTVMMISGHYLSHLHALNSTVTKNLKNVFEAVYEFNAQLLSRCTLSGDKDGQCVALAAWGIAISPTDHAFLNRVGIFRILQTILDEVRSLSLRLSNNLAVLVSSDNADSSTISDLDLIMRCDGNNGPFAISMISASTKRLSQLALRIVHSLASQVAFTKTSPTSNTGGATAAASLVLPAPRLSRMPSGPDTLSASLFEMLYSELFSGLRKLMIQTLRCGNDSPSVPAIFGVSSHINNSEVISRTNKYLTPEKLKDSKLISKVDDFSLDNDQHIDRILKLLFFVSSSKSCHITLSSPKWLSLLASSIGCGTMPIQRRVFRLIRRIVSSIHPSTFHAFIPSYFSFRDEVISAEAPLDNEDVEIYITSQQNVLLPCLWPSESKEVVGENALSDNIVVLPADRLIVMLLEAVSVVSPTAMALDKSSPFDTIHLGMLSIHQTNKASGFISAEALVVLRVLIGIPSWRYQIFEVLKRIINLGISVDFSSCNKPEGVFRSLWQKTYYLSLLSSCIGVCGGYMDRFRPGGLIMFKPNCLSTSSDTFSNKLVGTMHNTGLLLTHCTSAGGAIGGSAVVDSVDILLMERGMRFTKATIDQRPHNIGNKDDRLVHFTSSVNNALPIRPARISIGDIFPTHDVPILPETLPGDLFSEGIIILIKFEVLPWIFRFIESHQPVSRHVPTTGTKRMPVRSSEYDFESSPRYHQQQYDEEDDDNYDEDDQEDEDPESHEQDEDQCDTDEIDQRDSQCHNPDTIPQHDDEERDELKEEDELLIDYSGHFAIPPPVSLSTGQIPSTGNNPFAPPVGNTNSEVYSIPPSFGGLTNSSSNRNVLPNDLRKDTKRSVSIGSAASSTTTNKNALHSLLSADSVDALKLYIRVASLRALSHGVLSDAVCSAVLSLHQDVFQDLMKLSVIETQCGGLQAIEFVEEKWVSYWDTYCSVINGKVVADQAKSTTESNDDSTISSKAGQTSEYGSLKQKLSEVAGTAVPGVFGSVFGISSRDTAVSSNLSNANNIFAIFGQPGRRDRELSTGPEGSSGNNVEIGSVSRGLQDPSAYLSPFSASSSISRGADPAAMAEAINQMMDMGLPREWCETSLRRCRYNVEMAINMCFEHGDDMPRYVSEDASILASASTSSAVVGEASAATSIRERFSDMRSLIRGPRTATVDSHLGDELQSIISLSPGVAISSIASLSRALSRSISTSRSSNRSSESRVRQLTDMGFPISWCTQALSETNDDVSGALAWILAHGDELTSREMSPTAPQVSLNVDREREGTDLFDEKSNEDIIPLTAVSGYAHISSDLVCTVVENGFPSVGCRGYGVSSGKWYFEVTMLSAGCVQIGWVDSAYTGDSEGGLGVGDDSHSWAYDGWRLFLWHEISTPWGVKWNIGDTVGCLLDSDLRVMSFTLNGFSNEIQMGKAFENFEYSGSLYPCASFNKKEKIQFNFGEKPFKHDPPLGYLAFHEHITTVNVENNKLIHKINNTIFQHICVNNSITCTKSVDTVVSNLPGFTQQPLDNNSKPDNEVKSTSKIFYENLFENSLEENYNEKCSNSTLIKRYFNDDNSSSGSSRSERGLKFPSAQIPSVSAVLSASSSTDNASPIIRTSGLDLILTQLCGISKDICILYARQIILRVFQAIPRLFSSSEESRVNLVKLFMNQDISFANSCIKYMFPMPHGQDILQVRGPAIFRLQSIAKNRDSETLNETTEKSIQNSTSSLSFIETFMVLLRLSSAYSTRTKLYLQHVSISPVYLSPHHLLGSFTSVGGIPFLEAIRSAFNCLLKYSCDYTNTESSIKSSKYFIDKLLDQVLFDCLNSVRRHQNFDFRVDGGLVPSHVIGDNTTSNLAIIATHSLSIAIWLTGLLIEHFAKEMDVLTKSGLSVEYASKHISSDKIHTNENEICEQIGQWLIQLTGHWCLALRSPSNMVKIVACQILSGLVQEHSFVDSRFGRIPRDLVSSQLELIPTKRLRAIAIRRLQHERGNAPMCSEYLQVLLELVIAASYSRAQFQQLLNRQQSETNFAGETIMMKSIDDNAASTHTPIKLNGINLENESLLDDCNQICPQLETTADISCGDFNWEAFSGRVLSDESPVVWTGTITQYHASSLPSSDRRATSEGRIEYPPELLPGCRVLRKVSRERIVMILKEDNSDEDDCSSKQLPSKISNSSEHLNADNSSSTTRSPRLSSFDDLKSHTVMPTSTPGIIASELSSLLMNPDISSSPARRVGLDSLISHLAMHYEEDMLLSSPEGLRILDQIRRSATTSSRFSRVDREMKSTDVDSADSKDTVNISNNSRVAAMIPKSDDITTSSLQLGDSHEDSKLYEDEEIPYRTDEEPSTRENEVVTDNNLDILENKEPVDQKLNQELKVDEKPHEFEKPALAKLEPEFVQQVQHETITEYGTVIRISAWDDDLPGTARVIRWDNTDEEETVRWGAGGRHYDVIHVKMSNGKVVVEYPLPIALESQFINNYFGYQASYGVILRLRKVPMLDESSDSISNQLLDSHGNIKNIATVSRSSFSSDSLSPTEQIEDTANEKLSKIYCKYIGVMEWPDFNAAVLVEGLQYENNEGPVVLVEKKLLSGPKDSSWAIRFGENSYQSGVCFNLHLNVNTPTTVSDLYQDVSDDFQQSMLGTFAYTVNSLPYQLKNLKVTGKISVQRKRLFSFDENFHSSNVCISWDHLSVSKSSGGSSQGCVFGNIGFSSGIHYWEYKIETSEVGSVFIGISEKPGLPGLPTTGSCSRWMGCGFMSHRASLRAPSSTSSERIAVYGDIFNTGDIIGVLLDMNRGRLSFFLDGMQYGQHNLSDLGEAFDNLKSPLKIKPKVYYPVVGVSRYQDRVTITPRWLSSIGSHPDEEFRVISRAWRLFDYWSIHGNSFRPKRSDWTIKTDTSTVADGYCVMSNDDNLNITRSPIDASLTSRNSEISMNLWFYREAWREWKRWLTGKYLRVKTRCKSVPLVVDISPRACVKASMRLGLTTGLFHGDRVFFTMSSGRELETKEEAVILGAFNGQLWYRHDSQQSSTVLSESTAVAWALAPNDVEGMSIIRRSLIQNQFSLPTEIVNLDLPRIQRYHGGVVTLTLKTGAAMRVGLEIDTSTMIHEIEPNVTLYSIETRLNASNIIRHKVIYKDTIGWISERMRGGAEEVIIKRHSIVSDEDKLLLESMREQTAIKAKDLGLSDRILFEDVESISDAFAVWEKKLITLGYGDLLQSGGILSSNPMAYPLKPLETPMSPEMKPSIDDSFENYLHLASTIDGSTDWSVEADMQLSEFITKSAIRFAVSPQNLSCHILALSIESIDSSSSLLFGINPTRIIARAALLRVANQIISYAMPYIDLTLFEEKSRRDAFGTEDVIEVLPTRLPPPIVTETDLALSHDDTNDNFNKSSSLCNFVDLSSFSGLASKLLNTSKRESKPWMPSSWSRRVRLMRRMLFSQTKRMYWESLLEATTTVTPLPQDEYEDPREIKSISINRIKSIPTKLVSIPSVHDRIKQSVFGQLHKELRNWNDFAFRRSYIGKGHGGQKRFFKVKFLGEGVHDYGGPYRAVFEQIVDEIQCDHIINKSSEKNLLPFLLPSNNRLSSVGLIQDKFVLSTVPTNSPTMLEYIYFLGKILGSAVRQNLNLALDLSVLVYRPLVRLPLSRIHLETVDVLTVKSLDDITKKGLEIENRIVELRCLSSKDELDTSVNELNVQYESSDHYSADMLKDISSPDYRPDDWEDLTFTTYLPDGTRIPLLPNGDEIPVTRSNWRMYVSLVERARLLESSASLKCLRDGLAAVLPIELLPIFTSQELEQIVSGNSVIDISLLKQCTEYEDLTTDSPVVRYFWEVLEEFTNEDKILFLRFVWARSRMPSSAEDLLTNFKLQNAQGEARLKPDLYLPHAQTCFFSLSLPPYSSKEILREKLLYAIKNSPTMDADVRLHNADGWDNA